MDCLNKLTESCLFMFQSCLPTPCLALKMHQWHPGVKIIWCPPVNGLVLMYRKVGTCALLHCCLLRWWWLLFVLWWCCSIMMCPPPRNLEHVLYRSSKPVDFRYLQKTAKREPGKESIILLKLLSIGTCRLFPESSKLNPTFFLNPKSLIQHFFPKSNKLNPTLFKVQQVSSNTLYLSPTSLIQYFLKVQLP